MSFEERKAVAAGMVVTAKRLQQKHVKYYSQINRGIEMKELETEEGIQSRFELK